MTLITMQKGLSIADAANARTVAQTIKKVGEPVVIKVVCAVFRLFNDSVNSTLQMTALQLFEAAQIWCEEYPHETLKDLILCLKQVKAGKYGPIYNRVDVTVINEFFRQYLEEKAYFREKQNRQHISDNGAQVIAQLPEEQQQALKEVMKKSNLRKTDVTVPVPTHEAYVDHLKANVQTLDEDLLNELAGRAVVQGAREVLEIVDAEKIRRATKHETDVFDYENGTSNT